MTKICFKVWTCHSNLQFHKNIIFLYFEEWLLLVKWGFYSTTSSNFLINGRLFLDQFSIHSYILFSITYSRSKKHGARYLYCIIWNNSHKFLDKWTFIFRPIQYFMLYLFPISNYSWSQKLFTHEIKGSTLMNAEMWEKIPSVKNNYHTYSFEIWALGTIIDLGHVSCICRIEFHAFTHYWASESF